MLAKKDEAADQGTAAHARGAARVLIRLHETLARAIPGLADGSDPDYGHATRVALRRARAALHAVGKHLDAGSTRTLLADLRWLAALIGQRRDLVVVAAQVEALVEPTVWAQIAPLFAERQSRTLIAIRHGLALPRLRRLQRHLEAAIAAVAAIDEPVQERLAARRARKQLRQALADAAAIGDSGPPTPIHELRKALKKLRYTLELLRGREGEPWLRQGLAALKTLQDWLGHYQDLTVRTDLLEMLATDPLAARTPAAVPALHGLYDAAIAERDRMTGAFRAAFAPFLATVSDLQLSRHLRALARG